MSGAAGPPPCAPSDPACGPLYPRHNLYGVRVRRSAGCEPNRVRVHEADLGGPNQRLGGGGRCAHDGECVIAACGRSCVPWHPRRQTEWCDIGFPSEGWATPYCGCVGGACAWFHSQPK